MKILSTISETLPAISDGTHPLSSTSRQMDINKIRTSEFFSMMHEIAEAWTHGNSRKAAAHYTESALIEFCGGYRFSSPVRIAWRFLTFNEKEQIGYGEFCFHQIHVGESTAHVIKKYLGIAYIQVRDGKISGWREFRV
jgi:hypothetical protein